MKKYLLLLLPLLWVPAHAYDVHLGFVSCNYHTFGVGKCGTEPKILQFAKDEAAKKLGCSGHDNTPCVAALNKVYRIQVNVKEIIDTCDVFHYLVQLEPFFVPTNESQVILWKDPPDIFVQQTCDHQHRCFGSGPPGGNDN